MAKLGMGVMQTREGLSKALIEARQRQQTSVIVIETAYDQQVNGYESWWDVPIAEVSQNESVQTARVNYVQARKKQRIFWKCFKAGWSFGIRIATQR